MSDKSVAAALRSNDPVVVVEAPAGSGKTFQACGYADDTAATVSPGRVLILAHTNAACDTFATRLPAHRARVDVRTIDSLIVAIASAYPKSTGVSGDARVWVRRQNGGYQILASRVARLLQRAPGIARMLALRYTIVICDEHQDASADQHAIVAALLDAGARLRIFGDPMQALFDDQTDGEHRWSEICAAATTLDVLDVAHRWNDTDPALGAWILAAREVLRSGGVLNLAAVPQAVTVITADNDAAARHGYQIASGARKPIDAAAATKERLLILAARNTTVAAIRPFFNRRFPIWEGHVRDRLARLARDLARCKANPVKVAKAALAFTDRTCTGLPASTFGKILLQEVARGCAPARKGKPAAIQALGRLLIAEPDHRGVAKFLGALRSLASTADAFGGVQIDQAREYQDATAMSGYEDPETALAEIAQRRTATRSGPPKQAISTIHKAKGLEVEDVILLACDAMHFPDTPDARRLLYVALSRPRKRLTIVVSKSTPSPLITL
jgi:hypothetical protein